MTKITLLNEDVVEIKEFCSRKIFRLIQQKMLGEGSKISGSAENMEFDMNSINEAEDFAVLSMIKKITDKAGAEKEINRDYLDELPISDFNKIKEEVNKITNPTDTGKKALNPKSDA